MPDLSRFDGDATIVTERLSLTPLRVEDADELAVVLDDERLHQFIGGHPLSLADLRRRYRALTAGSSRPGELWLNWTIRDRGDQRALGTAQATVTEQNGRSIAHVAWVIGVDAQNNGYASEAAVALVDWLRRSGADAVVAHIHADHHASARVAAKAGLHPTDAFSDGEQIWRAPDLS